eukprot:518768-Rhodomonas_salina.1
MLSYVELACGHLPEHAASANILEKLALSHAIQALIGLSTCYAMPGSELAFEAIGLCFYYAMPGTDLVYAAASAL